MKEDILDAVLSVDLNAIRERCPQWRSLRQWPQTGTGEDVVDDIASALLGLPAIGRQLQRAGGFETPGDHHPGVLRNRITTFEDAAWRSVASIFHPCGKVSDSADVKGCRSASARLSSTHLRTEFIMNILRARSTSTTDNTHSRRTPASSR